jgi:hypothetical protein
VYSEALSVNLQLVMLGFVERETCKQKPECDCFMVREVKSRVQERKQAAFAGSGHFASRPHKSPSMFWSLAADMDGVAPRQGIRLKGTVLHQH